MVLIYWIIEMALNFLYIRYLNKNLIIFNNMCNNSFHTIRWCAKILCFMLKDALWKNYKLVFWFPNRLHFFFDTFITTAGGGKSILKSSFSNFRKWQVTLNQKMKNRFLEEDGIITLYVCTNKFSHINRRILWESSEKPWIGSTYDLSIIIPKLFILISEKNNHH